MPNQNPPRCRHCKREIELLPYTRKDGTQTHLAVEPYLVQHRDDRRARNYVQYTAPDGTERLRHVTPEEPWDEDNEHPRLQHLLVCRANPNSPAYIAPEHRAAVLSTTATR